MPHSTRTHALLAAAAPTAAPPTTARRVVRRATPATLTGVPGRPTLACAVSMDSERPPLIYRPESSTRENGSSQKHLLNADLFHGSLVDFKPMLTSLAIVDLYQSRVPFSAHQSRKRRPVRPPFRPCYEGIQLFLRQGKIGRQLTFSEAPLELGVEPESFVGQVGWLLVLGFEVGSLEGDAV